MNIWCLGFERFIEIIATLLEVYFLYLVLNTKVEVRKQIIATIVLVTIRLAYYSGGFNYRPLFCVITGIFYAAFLFSRTLKEYSLWMILLVALEGIIDAVVISMFLLIPNISVVHILESSSFRLLFIVSAKILLLIVLFFITRKINRSHRLTWSEYLSLLVLPLGCWVLLEALLRYIVSSSDRFLQLGCSFALLIIITSTISLFNRITVNTETIAETRLKLHTFELTEDHINQVNDLYDKLSSIRHDLKGHFLAIEGYLKIKEYDALEKYLEELTDEIFNMDQPVKHPVLNALISSKRKVAKELNIDFEIHLQLPEKFPLSDVELCVLFSNIINNAFEANQNSVNPKFIHLYSRMNNANWTIVCQNPSNKKEPFRGIGALKSTKATNSMYGIGTKQIQEIAEKYGGFLSYKNENYTFTILVLVKI